MKRGKRRHHQIHPDAVLSMFLRGTERSQNLIMWITGSICRCTPGVWRDRWRIRHSLLSLGGTVRHVGRWRPLGSLRLAWRFVQQVDARSPICSEKASPGIGRAREKETHVSKETSYRAKRAKPEGLVLSEFQVLH